MSNKIEPYTSIKVVYKKFHINERSHFVYKGIYNMHIKTAMTRISVVKSGQLLVKITACLVSIGWLLCLAFLYGWRFFKKISLAWLLTFTTWPSPSKFSDNPENAHVETDWLLFKSFSNHWTVFHYITQDSKKGCSLHRLPFGPCRDITSFYIHYSWPKINLLLPNSQVPCRPFCGHRGHKSNKGTKQ